MKIYSGDDTYYRPMQIRDLCRFYETMADWPKDAEGVFTFARAQIVIEKHIRNNTKVKFKKLNKKSKFNLVMVWCGGDDVMRGYWRLKAKGKVVHLAQAALHPEWRKKGVSRQLNACREWTLVHIFDPVKATFDIMSETAPEMTHINDRLNLKTEKSGHKGVTKQIVVSHEVSMKDFKKFLASPAAAKDNKFKFSTEAP